MQPFRTFKTKDRDLLRIALRTPGGGQAPCRRPGLQAAACTGVSVCVARRTHEVAARAPARDHRIEGRVARAAGHALVVEVVFVPARGAHKQSSAAMCDSRCRCARHGQAGLHGTRLSPARGEDLTARGTSPRACAGSRLCRAAPAALRHARQAVHARSNGRFERYDVETLVRNDNIVAASTSMPQTCVVSRHYSLKKVTWAPNRPG